MIISLIVTPAIIEVRVMLRAIECIKRWWRRHFTGSEKNKVQRSEGGGNKNPVHAKTELLMWR